MTRLISPIALESHAPAGLPVARRVFSALALNLTYFSTLSSLAAAAFVSILWAFGGSNGSPLLAVFAFVITYVVSGAVGGAILLTLSPVIITVARRLRGLPAHLQAVVALAGGFAIGFSDATVLGAIILHVIASPEIDVAVGTPIAISLILITATMTAQLCGATSMLAFVRTNARRNKKAGVSR